MATAVINKKPFGSRTTADKVLENINLDGKNIVVTGANTGIGYEAARALAAAGAHVIFACRSADKGEQAVANAKKQHPAAKVEFRQLNLASFENIRQFIRISIIQCRVGTVISRSG